MISSADFDIAIVGAGFGGSLLALVARSLGLRVVLIERGKHPRFAIGESTSPLTNLLLEEIARDYDLDWLLPLTQYGTWKRAYPNLTVGLKRGFTYYSHDFNQPFTQCPDRIDQLLVAASPHDELSDTHWLRSEFDQFVTQHAETAGVEYLDETAVESIEGLGSGLATFSLRRNGTVSQVTARLVIDATGPRGLLSRTLGLQDKGFDGFPVMQSLFSHFTDIPRCEELSPFQTEGASPYSPDDAALHHIFPGGWFWVLRFENGVTSAGVSAHSRFAHQIDLSEGEAAWPRLLDTLPSVREHLSSGNATVPFIYAKQLHYRCERAAGNGWAMLPSAAAFIDPLFSTGIPLTLLGVQRLGALLREHRTEITEETFQGYEAVTLAEADWVARYVGTCLKGTGRMEIFTPLSMLYFAIASYSEMARRLGKPELTGGFLGTRHPHFRPNADTCLQLAEALLQKDESSPVELEELGTAAARAIEPINIAGLHQQAKRNWYGVELQDVVDGAEKLGLSRDAMAEIVRTAAWAQIPE
jgi:FADH2 O2-dependent halogenase